MRRLGFVAGLLILPALVVLPSADALAEDEAAKDESVDAAYVKVSLTRDGKTYAHPGFRVGKDEEGLFLIECAGTSHEIAVVLLEGTAERLSVSVRYSVDGKAVLTEDLSVEAGKDTKLGKGATSLAINVDPRGKKDTSRKDEDKIDEPDSDDPLDGI